MEEYNQKYGSSTAGSEVFFVEDDEQESGQSRNLGTAGIEAMYGCWCGKGNRCTSVKDAVDGVCRAHDKCYDSKGTANCACERDLCKNMLGAMASVGADGKVAGTVARSIFCKSPCICDRVCVPWLCCSGWRCKGCKKCTKTLVPNYDVCY